MLGVKYLLHSGIPGQLRKLYQLSLIKTLRSSIIIFEVYNHIYLLDLILSSFSYFSCQYTALFILSSTKSKSPGFLPSATICAMPIKVGLAALKASIASNVMLTCKICVLYSGVFPPTFTKNGINNTPLYLDWVIIFRFTSKYFFQNLPEILKHPFFNIKKNCNKLI